MREAGFEPAISAMKKRSKLFLAAMIGGNRKTREVAALYQLNYSRKNKTGNYRAKKDYDSSDKK